MRKQFKQKAVGLLALACVASSAFALATYSASAEDICALTMREGAAVRIGNTQDGTGIRFAASVDESLLTINDGVATFKTDDAVTEVGMIIVPAKALENVGNADVFTYLQTTYQASKEEVSTQFIDSQIQKDAKGYYVAGAIVKIQDANLDLEYQAIPYTYDGDYTYGAKSDKRTISYVFNAALADTTEEGLAKKSNVLAKAIEMNAKLDLEVEGEIAAGLDLSDYACDDYVIESVKFAEAEANETVDNNIIDFSGAKEKAGLDKELVITYANNKGTLTVNADVWSLLIDVNTELTAQSLKEASYVNGNNRYGYYKLVDNLTMTYGTRVTNTGDTADSARFQGVFDGNEKTVTGLQMASGSLFGALGANAIIKDVNFVNAKFVDGGVSQTAILGSWAYGGTVENVSVTYEIPQKVGTNSGSTGGWMCGALFGQVFAGGRSGYSTINLNNVTIEATNADTAENVGWAAFGYVSSKPVAIFNATNVTIVGGDGIYSDAGTMVSEFNGITFTTGKPIVLEPIVLDAVDTEIGKTVDFTTLVPTGKTIESVSYNGAVLAENSVTFTEKSEASNVARTYTILTTDGGKYFVDVTVWSLLIDVNTELTAQSLKEASYVNGNNQYGYYKLVDDLTMTYGTRVTTAGYTADSARFQGVFDGNEKTVTNLQISSGSLFGSLGANAIIKDVNFANAKFVDNGASQSAILGSWAYGGTVENVSVTYEIPQKVGTNSGSTGGWMCGVLFGQVFAGGRSGYSTINLNNVTIEATNADTAENVGWAAFGYVSSKPVAIFNATNVTIVGGDGIYSDAGTMVSEFNGITFTTGKTN